MFYKYFTILLLLLSLLLSKVIGVEYEGIRVKTIDTKGNTVYTVVKRDISKECKTIPLTNTILWTGNYAHTKVPEACKST